MPFKLLFLKSFFHRLAQEQEGFLLCDYPKKNQVRAIAGETESMADAGEGERYSVLLRTHRNRGMG